MKLTLGCPLQPLRNLQPPFLRRLFFRYFDVTALVAPVVANATLMELPRRFTIKLGIDRKGEGEPFHWVTGKSSKQNILVREEQLMKMFFLEKMPFSLRVVWRSFASPPALPTRPFSASTLTGGPPSKSFHTQTSAFRYMF